MTRRCDCGGALKIDGELSWYGDQTAKEVYQCCNCGNQITVRLSA